MADGILIVERPTASLIVLANAAQLVIEPEEAPAITVAEQQVADMIVTPQAATAIVYADGKQGPSGTAAVTELGFAWEGTLQAGEKLPKLTVSYNVFLTAEDSVAFVDIAPEADLVLLVHLIHGGTDNVIGSVTFHAGQTEGIFSYVVPRVAVVHKDRVYLEAPALALTQVNGGTVTVAGR